MCHLLQGPDSHSLRTECWQALQGIPVSIRSVPSRKGLWSHTWGDSEVEGSVSVWLSGSLKAPCALTTLSRQFGEEQKPDPHPHSWCQAKDGLLPAACGHFNNGRQGTKDRLSGRGSPGPARCSPSSYSAHSCLQLLYPTWAPVSSPGQPCSPSHQKRERKILEVSSPSWDWAATPLLQSGIQQWVLTAFPGFPITPLEKLSYAHLGGKIK